MPFPESFLDELLARSDIADVVGSYVQLTKKSGANLFGLCPFHSEKTPSFSVSPEKQIYHCFGCGKGGSAINFIMEIENLNFPDAVHFLAKRAGLTVPEEDGRDQNRGKRTRMLELNRAAARFFYECLSKPEGERAVAYMRERGIAAATAKRFGLGCAPDSWNALTDAMTRAGYSASDLLDAGLVKRGKSGRGLYDTFRNRLMFPVIDVRGSVIGFSGRILGDGEPKYLNSPDTLVFTKGRNLFALNLAKKSKQGILILAEGNIDVVSLHQAGFDCAVASLGTSLTDEQARLMARYTKNVVLAYDSDTAGVKAARRAIDIFDKTGVAVKVLRMEGAKDPDEYIKKRGADAFRVLLEKSENDAEYLLLTARSKYDMETDEGRLGFLAEAAELLAAKNSPVEREVYGARAADYAGVSAEAVKNEVQRLIKKKAFADKKRKEREEAHPSRALQPSDKSLRYENAVSAAAEEGVIRLLVMDPSLLNEADITEEDFSSPFLGRLFSMLAEKSRGGAPVSLALLASELPPQEASQLTVLLRRPESPGNARQAMRDYIEKIKTERLKKAGAADLAEVSRRYREKKGLEDARYGK